MKTIIAGSRNATEEAVNRAIFSVDWEITEVVSGGARGADHYGELFADLYDISIKIFPADWDTHGKRAGYLRNEEMAKYADALIAVWDGESKGTKHMIDLAIKYKLKYILVHIYDQS